MHDSREAGKIKMDLDAVPLAADERRLLERAADWQARTPLDALSNDDLRSIAAAEGVEFATALAYVAARNSAPCLALQQALQSIQTADRVPHGWRLAIVPGAFYREFPRTGADGAQVRRAAAEGGWGSDVIPTASFGPLAHNAQCIIDWLLHRPATETLILVSLCKGGGEVKLALEHAHAQEAFSRVAAWVNLSGMLYGTPLVEWVLARRLRRFWYRALLGWRGYDFSVIHDLGHGPDAPLAAPLRLPPHVRMVSVVGFPLRRHLSTALARRCHRRVAHLGPSDGAGILLADACRVPGWMYPVWGADHYLRPLWQGSPLLLRLLSLISRDGVPGDAREAAAGSARVTT